MPVKPLNMLDHPNVIILVSHDTGRHVSPYGIDTVDTPNFEKLAAESVRFSNAFCATPQCSPARAALFSGRYPHSVGVMGNVGLEHGWRFPDEERHAARLFSDAGYASWLLGLLHETYLPETLGFETIDLGFTILEAGAHLDAFLSTHDQGKPFYCQIGCKETHRPWDANDTPPDDARGVFVPPYLHNGPETRRDLAQLQGYVRRLDTGLGRIIDTLANRGVAENTILVVTTDHGLAVPRAKGTLHDSGTGVLLFLRFPRRGWGGGTVQEELVSHVDVLPTVLEACGIGVPANMQGRSFRSLLTGGQYSPRGAVFTEKTHFHFYDPMRAVRTHRHRYIRNFEFCRQTEVLLDHVHSGSFRELGNRYAGGHPAEELYDLENDPNEMTNVAQEPAFAGVREGLAERLRDWMIETDDPLIRGPIPSPFYHREIERMFGDDS